MSVPTRGATQMEMRQLTRKREGDVLGPVSELLHHHERGEHDEDLAPCPGQELERVVEPVARAEHDRGGLVHGVPEMGESEPAEGRDAERHHPPGEEHLEIGEPEERQRAEDETKGGERGERGDRPHAAEDHGKLARARPLHGEGLLHGREVVEAGGHHQRREVDAPDRRQEADEGNPDPHHRERQDREGLLAPDEEHEDDREREEARHLAKALEEADLAPGECRLLDHEVVDEDRPRLEGDG